MREMEKKDVKMRWSEEEVSLLALKEVELVRGGTRFLNIALLTFSMNRSVEAIKKVRQRADYKLLVSKLLNAAEGQGTSGIRAPALTSFAFVEHILNTVGAPPHDQSSNELLSIVRAARVVSKDESLCKLTATLISILPTREQRSQTRPPVLESLNSRQRRRMLYAQTQRNFKQHQGRCIKSIIEGARTIPIPSQDRMEPYWRAIMEKEELVSPVDELLHRNLNDVWSPITVDEIKHSLPSLTKSPGLDGVTSQDLRNIPHEKLMIVYNMIMFCEKCPFHLQKAKTVFLPKGNEAVEPGDFRPITIPPVSVRHLHSIIAHRINVQFKFDSRQRAFRPTNGCADNTTLLDMVLRNNHQNYNACYIASLDISKAFDSVSHGTILGTLRSYGFPEGFVAYMDNIYSNSTTVLMAEDWGSGDIHPKRGVKQGDPLSPVIFNLIINRLLEKLPDEVGVSVGSTNINAIAFADDIVLLASTPKGLQLLLDLTHEFFNSCGMMVNRSKCFTVSIEASGKKKHTFVGQRAFKIGGYNIPVLNRSEEWCYLGINFTADGRSKFYPHVLLGPKLANLRKAPLKPQQRLHALRTFLIPQLYHRLTLGNVMIGSLNKTDALIREAVRNWLNLPKDVPNAFFHAPTSHGGLGIPALRWVAPCLRLHCLENLNLPRQGEALTANTLLASELDKAKRRLQVDGELLISTSAINSFWSKKLHASVDGTGLREAGDAPFAHRWIREPSKLLTGSDYLNCIKLRINALPSKSRTTRGRARLDRNCRGGCLVPETTNHILQKCHRTHGSRVERHDSVVKFLKRSLDGKGWVTNLEPHLLTSSGLRKPDLVAIKDNDAVVIDAQIVTDGYNTNVMHQTKVRKYDTDEIKDLIKERFNVPGVVVTSATLNWRGIWAKQSINELLALGIINKNAAALVSTRVAIGGVRSFRIFNQMTAVRSVRTGVG